MDLFRLLLPAIIPSWRFFDIIAPSPRLEYVLLNNNQDTAENWQEFRPRPKSLSIIQMLLRLFWNPKWNETLFLVSCSERLINEPTQHSRNEIRDRMRAEFKNQRVTAVYFQFRLQFVHRDGDSLEQETRYLSPVFKVGADGS